MVSARIAGLLLVVCGSMGCVVVPPRGWNARGPVRSEAHVVHEGLRREQRWTLSPSGSVALRSRRVVTASGFGVRRAVVDFEIWDESDPTRSFRCASGARPRFVCEGEDGARFEIDVAGCPSRGLASAETLMDPKCWRGRLVSAGDELDFEQGYMKRSEAPVAWFTWSRGDSTVAFADALSTSRMRWYSGETDVPEETWRHLELLSIAATWWQRSIAP